MVYSSSPRLTDTWVILGLGSSKPCSSEQSHTRPSTQGPDMPCVGPLGVKGYACL